MATTASANLQIPSNDLPGPSRHNHHHQQQIQQQTQPYRPVSVAVQPTPASSTSPPPSSSRRQRASHTVQPSSRADDSSSSANPGTGAGGGGAGGTAYHDVYSHPAAVAYLAAHPRRTIPKFGPYLLLHTLGEGEFGKVKLGLHSLWGEEVAVKLIRRGNVDNSVRMSKVEREIEVLRTLKHPNIVRLYDVIETDKYIGIILEYASGGELFDHILAHRYLREPYASKLFYQLLSGVWYIHQKKIVHRDLKLENLLLDRHRNILITDFGFANRFEHRPDDLMQTSCGSPCYAAPELVISEGSYVGSAVDIWSCGVILYAMLAGYLPFDDDPANPDGDNINLLYKYIVNTPLTFPDYISDQARDLLSMMLVPDPARRASLEQVMDHPWLAAFHVPPPADAEDNVPRAFGKSVEDLERQAMEQHQMKRLAYQRQMRAAAQQQQQQQQSPSITSPHGSGGRHGHHSYQPDVFTTGPASAGVVSPSSRHRDRDARGGGDGGHHHRERTQPEYLYETSLDQSYASTVPSPGMPTPPTSAPAISSGGGSAAAGSARKGFVPSPIAMPMDEDDPFSIPPTGSKSAGVVPPSSAVNSGSERERRPSDAAQSSRTGGGRDVLQSPPVPSRDATATTTNANAGASASASAKSPKKGADGFNRHTIQVEYDEGKSGGSGRRSEDRTNASTTRRSEDRDKERRRERKERERSASPRRAAAANNSNSVVGGVGRSPSVGGSPRDNRRRASRERGQNSHLDGKPLPPSPHVAAAAAAAEQLARPDVEMGTGTEKEKGVVGAGEKTPTKASIRTTMLNGASTPTASRTNAPAPLPLETPPPVVNINAASPPGTPITFASPTAKDRDDISMDVDLDMRDVRETEKEAKKKPSNEDKSSQTSKGSGGHRRGLSAVGLGKIFGGGGSGGGGGSHNSSNGKDGRVPSDGSDAASGRSTNGGKSGSRRPSTLQLPSDAASGKSSSTGSTALLSPDSGVEKEGKEGGGKDGKKGSRRNTLTVMVEPFSRSIRNRNAKGRGASTPLPTPGPETATTRAQMGVIPPGTAGLSTEKGSEKSAAADGFIKVSNADTSVDLGRGMQASTSKAKKVMQWFRNRSGGGRDSIGLGEPPVVTGEEVLEKEPAERSRTPTQVPFQKANASSTTVNQTNVVAEKEKPVVTPREPKRATLQPPSHPQRSASSGTSSPIARWIRPSLTGAISAATAGVASAGIGGGVKSPNEVIRIHHGPVDTTTITTMAPPEVMKKVRTVLREIGVEVQAESEYKYRCVRAKRKKAIVGSVVGSVGGEGGGAGGSLAAVTMMGSAASNGVDKRGLPVPSHASFSGNMLKGLLMRRQSSQVSAPSMQQSLSFDDDAISPVTGDSSSFNSAQSQEGITIYGDPSQDAGDEVRFSVELTRLDRLNDTYSVDIRRLKGNLRSYKFLYETVRERADLQR